MHETFEAEITENEAELLNTLRAAEGDEVRRFDIHIQRAKGMFTCTVIDYDAAPPLQTEITATHALFDDAWFDMTPIELRDPVMDRAHQQLPKSRIPRQKPQLRIVRIDGEDVSQ